MYGFQSPDKANVLSSFADILLPGPATDDIQTNPISAPPNLLNDLRFRTFIAQAEVTEEITAAEWDSTANPGAWTAGVGKVRIWQLYNDADDPDNPLYRMGVWSYATSAGDGDAANPPTITKHEKTRRCFNTTTVPISVTSDPPELILVVEDVFGDLWVSSGGGGGAIVGRVVNADIQTQSAGEIELFTQNEIPTGNVVPVFNPHDVVFSKENTIPGEEHPADRLIAWSVPGWEFPLVYPYMLSKCTNLDPTFEPIQV